MSARRTLRLWRAALTLLAAATMAAACGGGGGAGGPTQVSQCQVVAAAVSPTTISVAVGDTVMLSVGYSTATICGTHPTVTWSADNTSAVTLRPDGEVVYVIGQAISVQPVTVTASLGGVSAKAQVTVLSPPSIKLTPQSLTFTAIQNQENLPDSQTVQLRNGGGGVLSQVGPGAPVYGPGATGWLFMRKSALVSTAPYDVFFQPRNTNFPPGTYTATVPVTSPVATNSPQNITVTYTITSGSNATLISSLSVFLVTANGCSTGAGTGNSFRVSFDFTTPGGNAFTGTINERVVFQPSGSTGTNSVPVPSAQVSIVNNTMTTGVCVTFAGATSMDFTVTLQNTSGQSSNSLTVNVSKPAGGALVGRGSPTFAPSRVASR